MGQENENVEWLNGVSDHATGTAAWRKQSRTTHSPFRRRCACLSNAESLVREKAWQDSTETLGVGANMHRRRR